jgi:hypothetical protein
MVLYLVVLRTFSRARGFSREITGIFPSAKCAFAPFTCAFVRVATIGRKSQSVAGMRTCPIAVGKQMYKVWLRYAESTGSRHVASLEQ